MVHLPKGNQAIGHLSSVVQYVYLKALMCIYIQALDYQKVIIKGPYAPTIKVNDFNVSKIKDD